MQGMVEISVYRMDSSLRPQLLDSSLWHRNRWNQVYWIIPPPIKAAIMRYRNKFICLICLLHASLLNAQVDYETIHVENAIIKGIYELKSDWLCYDHKGHTIYINGNMYPFYVRIDFQPSWEALQLHVNHLQPSWEALQPYGKPPQSSWKC